jgi:hypothetical protein
MIDLERELRLALEEDARIAPPPADMDATLRQTHRRQVRVVATGLIAAVMIVAGATAGVTSVMRSSEPIPAEPGPESTKPVPYGIDAVDWPTDRDAIDQLLIAAPAALAERGFQVEVLPGTWRKTWDGVPSISTPGVVVCAPAVKFWGFSKTPGELPRLSTFYCRGATTFLVNGWPGSGVNPLSPAPSPSSDPSAVLTFERGSSPAQAAGEGPGEYWARWTEPHGGWVYEVRAESDDALARAVQALVQASRDSAGAGSEPSPSTGPTPSVLYGVDTVGWPTDRDVIDELLLAAPAALAERGFEVRVLPGTLPWPEKPGLVVCSQKAEGWGGTMSHTDLAERAATMYCRGAVMYFVNGPQGSGFDMETGTWPPPSVTPDPLTALTFRTGHYEPSKGGSFMTWTEPRGGWVYRVEAESRDTLARAVEALVQVAQDSGLGAAAPGPEPSPSVDTAQSAVDADLQTKAELERAMHAALASDTFSLAGLTPKQLGSILPGLEFNASRAAVAGEISVRAAEEARLVLAERSPSGTVFCIATKDHGWTITYDTVDAQSAAECRSTSWPYQTGPGGSS